MASASGRSPELQADLLRSAEVLRNTRSHLDKVLAHRDEFEETVKQTVEVTVLAAQALPWMLENLGEGLRQQEESLVELGDSIEGLNEAVPPAAEWTSRLLLMTRMLLCLGALIFGLHGGYLLVTNSYVTEEARGWSAKTPASCLNP
jgi:hypothetical protein